jgi:hypothetical protein
MLGCLVLCRVLLSKIVLLLKQPVLAVKRDLNFSLHVSKHIKTSISWRVPCSNRRSCRYLDEDTGKITLYDILKYESAGIWVDSLGYPCLPIMAVFEDDEQEMRLLYSSNYRSSRRAVNSETQWIRKRGRNPGIKAPLHGQ